MNSNQQYLLVYLEPHHKPIYLLATTKSVINQSKSLKDLIQIANKNGIEIEKLPEPDSNTLEQLRELIHTPNCEFIMTHNQYKTLSENYYVLAYYENKPGHIPKYFLTCLTKMRTQGFETVDEVIKYAMKKDHIGREHIVTDISEELLKQIKYNIGYLDSEIILSIKGLENIIKNSS